MNKPIVKNNIARELVNELKKVSWPTKNETIQLTIIVILISLIIGFYIGIIDSLLAYVLESFTDI
jgi:preprotein translocase subunit SecE